SRLGERLKPLATLGHSLGDVTEDAHDSTTRLLRSNTQRGQRGRQTDDLRVGEASQVTSRRDLRGHGKDLFLSRDRVDTGLVDRRGQVRDLSLRGAGQLRQPPE